MQRCVNSSHRIHRFLRLFTLAEVLIAHLLLTHLAATDPGAQANEKATPLDPGRVMGRLNQDVPGMGGPLFGDMSHDAFVS